MFRQEPVKERREQIERRNTLENMAYSDEKTLTESRDKLAAADVTQPEQLIKEGREAVEKQDDSLIRGTLEHLDAESHRIAQKL